MAEGELHELVRSFLQHLKETGKEADQAVVYGPLVKSPGTIEQEIDLLVIADSFGEDYLADGRLLLQAAWETDPRIVPCPVQTDAWADADEDPRLFWARENGIVITL